MNKNTNKWQNASQKAHRTARWAKTMTKWLISKKNEGGAKWHVVNFVGSSNSESRGIVDLLAIRKDHRTNDSKIKRGDLFDVVLIQVKGGSAPFPTTEDIARLKEVSKYHRAKAIVLSEWKPQKRLQLHLLKRNKWIQIKPNEIF
ncbi:MAG: hypothetical protein JW976_01570 [Syntrophaceae bacterium]|nr:hypothetical protein [Syntrophaceae bacterium]